MAKDKDWQKAVGKRRNAQKLRNKSLTKSSQAWVRRQINDPYVAAAKEMGYRSRAAFKLLELNEKYKLLHKNQKIIDLGAAPGGWTQIAVAKSGAGNVVGIDLLEVEPIDGAMLLVGDVRDEESIRKVLEWSQGGVDLVLSDMAPNSSGDTKTDHLRVVGLAEIALEVAVDVLKPGGSFLCKFWQGGAEGELRQKLQKHFAKVRYSKPGSSRKDSAEMYLVAEGFRK